MVLPLEAVADAIMHYEGWMPGTVSNRNRNPGNLRHSILKKGEDPAGYCVFVDLPTGYNALIADLEAKFSGRSESGLGPQSTLIQLFQVYAPSGDGNIPAKYCDFVVRWVGAALHRHVTPKTTLGELLGMAYSDLPSNRQDVVS